MQEITIGGVLEQEFRRSIEELLRHGEADEAARRLRALIEPYAGSGKPLSGRFLHVTAADITLPGWGDLEQNLARYDRPDNPVSAISLMVAESGGSAARPDENGLLAPFVEVSFFSDEAYPFADADRADLLDGYSSFGCEWAGDVEGVDHSITIDGIDDLYGGLAKLEARLFAMNVPPENDIAAGTVGSCYLAVLIHQAVRDTIRSNSLPRPLAVMAGNNGTYPFFDAPVMSIDEYLAHGVIAPLKHETAPAPVEPDHVVSKASDDEEYDLGSLLGISLSAVKPKKKMALVLADDDLNDSFELMAEAQFMSLGGVASGLAPPPPPRVHFDFTAMPPVWNQGAEDIFEDPGSFSEAEDAAPPVDYNQPHEPALPELALEQEPEPEREPEPEALVVPDEPATPHVPSEPEVFVPTGRVPLAYEPYREPEHIDTGDHDVWGALTSRMPPVAPGAFGTAFGRNEDTEPRLAPGQEPEVRGHSLRKVMITFEPEPEPKESLFAVLLARIKGWFGRAESLKKHSQTRLP